MGAIERLLLVLSPLPHHLAVMDMIEPRLVGLTYLSDQLPVGVLLAKNEGGLADFLVCDAPSGKVAVALDHPGSMYPGPFMYLKLIAVLNSWRGAFLSDVKLEVEPTSWFTMHSRHPRPGEIAVRGGKVFVTTRGMQPGGPSFELIEWGPSVSLGHGVIDGGFTDWRIVESTTGSVIRVFGSSAPAATSVDTLPHS